MLLPFYFFVIVASLVAVVWGIRSIRESSKSAPDPDPDVTAFWVEHGGAFTVRYRTLASDVITDIADGGTCQPGTDLPAARCPELPAIYDHELEQMDALIADARQVQPPPGTLAEEWWNLQLTAWDRFREHLARFARLSHDGFAREGWQAAMETYRQDNAQGDAEMALARMLVLVEPEKRLDPVRVNP